MARRFGFAISLILFAFTAPSMADDIKCNKRQFKTLVTHTNISFQLNRLQKAQGYGEDAVKCGRTLKKIRSKRFIKTLNLLNHIYKKLGQLADVDARVEEAYLLSQKHLGSRHEVTMQSRDLYFITLIKNSKYKSAIPLALENIAASDGLDREEFRRHHYLVQLYSLYGLTHQYKEEGQTLRQLLPLSTEFFGRDDKETRKYALDLAKNYCQLQDKRAFEKLVANWSLKYKCA